jgi:reversibly glycosylated polypeptide / UDP-arabinopyranose mutase
MRKALIIPTNRPERLHEWAAAWQDVGDWDVVYLILDRAGTCQLDWPWPTIVKSWDHLDQLDPRREVFSRQDSAIRCFGFMLAWQDGCEWIGTLDDDCYPADVPWFAGHIADLTGRTRWYRTVRDVRPRGLPYKNLGHMPHCVVSHGLWHGVPDLDAPNTLCGNVENYQAPRCPEIVPRGLYLPLCGMNLVFHRQAAPLMYFPLMGQGSPYRRFDDIWCGILAKKCLDALGWSLVNGGPRIKHIRASDPFVNLVKEAPGIAANETFWQTVDQIAVLDQKPLDCMRTLACGLQAQTDQYLQKLGLALTKWVAYFREE